MEQVSNWEKRPLRNSQVHYGALDAWILLRVTGTLYKKAMEQGADYAAWIFNENRKVVKEGKPVKLD